MRKANSLLSGLANATRWWGHVDLGSSTRVVTDPLLALKVEVLMASPLGGLGGQQHNPLSNFGLHALQAIAWCRAFARRLVKPNGGTKLYC